MKYKGFDIHKTVWTYDADNFIVNNIFAIYLGKEFMTIKYSLDEAEAWVDELQRKKEEIKV